MTIPVDCDFGLEIVQHMNALRRYARVLVRTADGADDLVQDCVARAIDRSHLYRPDSDLRAWLFTVLRNIFMTQSRKETYRRNRAFDYAAVVSGVAAPNQFHAVALKESLQLTKSLSAAERQAVLLLGMFGMTYDEAADRAGAPVGTIRSRASRGRARLRLLAEPASAVG